MVKLRNSIFLCIIICLCLCSCSKEDSVINGAFGVGDPSKTELESNNQGVEITVESTTNEEDKFKIDTDEIDLTSTESNSEEEKSIEKAESEYQSIDELGNVTDSRDSINYYGLLQFINYSGGIEKVASTYSKEVFTEELNKFELVSESEKEQVLEAIYNASSEERNLLINDLLHTGEGWVYTDSGWKNVYEETNNVDYYEIDGGE